MKLHSFGFMAIHSIDYEEVNDLAKLGKAPKQKFPYLEDGDTVVADSSAILEYLSNKHNIDMDSWLSSEQHAVAYLVGKSLEENLYWCLVHSRWINNDTWPTVKAHYFSSIPFPLNHIVPAIARNGTIKRINGHGMGAHSVEEVLEIATRSFASLSNMLGDKAFFFGEQMSSFDLIAFSQLSSHTLVTLNNPMIQACREHTNLVEFTARIQATYFADV